MQTIHKMELKWWNAKITVLRLSQKSVKSLFIQNFIMILAIFLTVWFPDWCLLHPFSFYLSLFFCDRYGAGLMVYIFYRGPEEAQRIFRNFDGFLVLCSNLVYELILITECLGCMLAILSHLLIVLEPRSTVHIIIVCLMRHKGFPKFYIKNMTCCMSKENKTQTSKLHPVFLVYPGARLGCLYPFPSMCVDVLFAHLLLPLRS